MVFALAYGLAHLYAYCYVGKHSTDYYLAYADYLYESNWMYLPLELRCSFPFMIAHAQQPLRYHGFHVAILDFDLFTKVQQFPFTFFSCNCFRFWFLFCFLISADDKNRFQLLFNVQNIRWCVRLSGLCAKILIWLLLFLCPFFKTFWFKIFYQ